MPGPRPLRFRISQHLLLPADADQSLREALAAVDRLHVDSPLPQVPVVCTRGDSPSGEYTEAPPGDEPRCTVNLDGQWPALTLLHELGHLLDRRGIRSSGQNASVSDSRLHDWWQAIAASHAVGQLRALLRTPKHRVPAADGSFRVVPINLLYIEYLVRRPELFARSYAQFVATRGGSQCYPRNCRMFFTRSAGPM